LAGKNLDNPTSPINSSAMLLNCLGEKLNNTQLLRAGEAIQKTVEASLSQENTRTKDLGGKLGTKAFTDNVVLQLNLLS